MTSCCSLPIFLALSNDPRGATIDVAVHRFPFCIVWSPIPILTWFLPFIGHLGLADSKGVIFDFAGPYTIGRDDFAFGAPTRYLQCQVAPEAVDQWDEALVAGCKIYEKRMHNLCCDNCHSHVAVCLEHAGYAGRTRWNMVELCFWVFFRAKYVGVAGFVKSWLPFASWWYDCCCALHGVKDVTYPVQNISLKVAQGVGALFVVVALWTCSASPTYESRRKKDFHQPGRA
ncbi:Transmembrane protein 222 [Phytophthora ramorum]|uniref:Transmembrane protein 222 n=1 Tax=Phytophthora ramorum TaxID=164328 RepID=UPI0030B19043|nr:Transmembrane protein 222 [Phytophthora ramorum]